MTEPGPMFAAGEVYEPYVGRWSRLVAPEFVAWLGVPAGAHWIDVGCGTGELTRAVLASAHPASVRGVEPSPGFVEYARAHTPDPRATFAQGNAQELPVGDATADAVVSGLVLNFVPDIAAALAEFRRVTRPGATIAAYVWDYAGEMQMMRRFWDAAIALDPAAVEFDEGPLFPICQRGGLERAFAEAGLREFEGRAIDVPTVFVDFDDFWQPFLGGQAPAPRYAMSLSEDRRAALRESLHASLPIVADGSIALFARAWAVKATIR